jgi:flagellar basal body-associated protein FliL
MKLSNLMRRDGLAVLLIVALIMMLAGATTTLLFLTSVHGTEIASKDSKAEIATKDSEVVAIIESNPDGILT